MSTTDKYNAHLEELYCDFKAGEYAGRNNSNSRVYEELIAESPETDTHPGGQTRLAVYTPAKNLASGDPLKIFVPQDQNPLYLRKREKLLSKLLHKYTDHLDS